MSEVQSPTIGPERTVQASPPEPVRSGLEGVVAFATEIAEPDKAGGALRYRGVDIENLVGVVPYEQVWGLLVDGHLKPGLPPAEPHTLTVRSGDPRVDVQAALAMLAPEWGFGQLIDISGEEARENLARASVMALSFVAQSARGAGRPPVPQTAVDQAENRQRAAQSQLSMARAHMAEAAANVAQAQAATDRVEEELANATIRAPIRGTILARDVEVGSPVSSILNMGAAATPVVTMGDISQVFVRGKVDETEIGNLRLGQPARITVETFKDRTFQGKVTQISPMGVERDNVTNFEVRVSIDNPGNALKANMTANAEIVLEERPNSLIVPEAAISYDAKRSASVDVLDRGARSGRRRVPIKVGISNGTRTQVIEGLKEGDRVVLPN